MDKGLRREMTIYVGNTLLLQVVAEARESGRISSEQFVVISQAMTILFEAYEMAHPISVIPEGNGTVN